MIQNLHSEGASTVYGDEVTLKPTYCRYCYAAAVGPVFDTQYRIAGMVVNWTLPAGTLTNSLSYGQYKDSETFDYTPSYGVINVLYGLPVPANTAVIGTLYPSMRKITEELRFATSRFGNFEGLAGLFYTHEHNEYDVNVTNRVPPTLVAVPPPFDNFITADTTPLYEEYAAFADLTYYFAPTLDFTVGGRYTHNDQHAASYGSGILNGGVVTRSEFESSEHPTTYLATLRYRPMTDLDLYARIATGYRPGGPQTLAGPNIPPSFKADTTRNYEIGAKGRWLEGRLTTNLALYYIAWNDIQLNELINGLQVQGNGGKAKSKGAEFDLAFLPVRGLTTQLSASYNRATTDVAVPIVGAQAGDTLPYAAKFNAAVTGDYEFPITPALKGDVGATYAYQGSRPTSWSMDPLNVPTFLPGYSTLALRTGVQWDKYSLQLRAENVTDKYAYETSSVGNIFPGQGSPAQSVLITPRTFVLEFNARF
jgi:outer membrane receptor protein involved in Fe transport